MKDDPRAVSALAESVQDSISIIETGITAYVFQRHDPAYRQVAVELRKLLMDRSAASSYAKSLTGAKKAKNIFELLHGNGKNIFLNSFRPSKIAASEEFVDATPNIYKFRGDILHAATHDTTLVPLRAWLDEDLAYDRNGQILKVGTTIKHIAGKEGSHIINPVGDRRDDIAVAFFHHQPSSADIESADFNETNPWRQFIIDAAMRLLQAKSTTGNRLIEHQIDVPATRRDDSTLRLQRRLRR